MVEFFHVVLQDLLDIPSSRRKALVAAGGTAAEGWRSTPAVGGSDRQDAREEGAELAELRGDGRETKCS